MTIRSVSNFDKSTVNLCLILIGSFFFIVNRIQDKKLLKFIKVVIYKGCYF